MFDRSLGLLVSCALGASALLLPPIVAVEDSEARPFFVDGKDINYTFPCPSCDSEYDSAYNNRGGLPDKVLVRLHVAEDNSGLLIDDTFIFPQEKFRQDPFVAVKKLQLSQLPGDTTEIQIETDDYPRMPLDVDAIGLVENSPVPSQHHTILSTQLRFLGLGGKRMDDLPIIFIQMLLADDGELLILSVDSMVPEDDLIKTAIPIEDSFPHLPELDSIPFEVPPHRSFLPHEPSRKPECRLPGPLCAFSRFIGSTFGSAHRRPCPGRKPMSFDGEHLPTHRRPHFEQPADEFSALPMPEAGPGSEPFWRHHGPGRHGHHNHHRHGFFHMVSRGILAVLIPIMAGITVGIIVSVLGLLFGRFLGYLWFTAFRSGRRGYTSVSAEEAYPVDAKLTAAAAEAEPESEQPLPPYEDAPAYEETAQDKPSA